MEERTVGASATVQGRAGKQQGRSTPRDIVRAHARTHKSERGTTRYWTRDRWRKAGVCGDNARDECRSYAPLIGTAATEGWGRAASCLPGRPSPLLSVQGGSNPVPAGALAMCCQCPTAAMPQGSQAATPRQQRTTTTTAAAAASKLRAETQTSWTGSRLLRYADLVGNHHHHPPLYHLRCWLLLVAWTYLPRATSLLTFYDYHSHYHYHYHCRCHC